MKKYLKRLIILGGIILVYLLAHQVCNHLERKYNQPRTVIFSLPFPDDIVEKYQINTNETVEKVILAGFFSDWDANDKMYQMEKISSNNWQYTMKFAPGDNQYKFVVYLKGRKEAIWSQDEYSKLQAPDSFGGVNSIIHIRTTRNFLFFANIFLLGAIGIIILYSILEPIIKIILKWKLKFQYKLAINVLLIGLVSNVFFIGYNFIEQRRMIKQGFVETINLVHNYLLSHNIDFANLNNKHVAKKVETKIRILLKRTMARIEQNKFSNIQIITTDIVLFDPEYNILAIGTTDNGISIHKNSAIRYGFPSVEKYVRNGMFGRIIENAKKQLKPLTKNIVTGKTDQKYTQHISPKARNNYLLLGSNCYLMPIIHNHKLVGYYGVAFTTELFGDELKRILLFNLYLLIATAILFAFLLSNIGELIAVKLNSLIEWTQAIIRGDFDVEKSIKTNDEIEVLANNFDSLRISLGRNMANLRLMNMVSSSLQAITNIHDLYKIFLTFITANFGFRYNRAAIFLREGQNLVGHYGVGVMDEQEIKDKFGSYENYDNFRMDINSFLQNYKRFFDRAESRFLNAVHNTTIERNANSIFWEALDKNIAIPICNIDTNINESDKTIMQRLNLGKFVMLPIFKGKDKIGVLLVDNRFHGNEITEENINQLQILVNQFAVNLENAYMINNLEQKVWERAAELQEERNKLKDRNRIIEQTLKTMRTELEMAKQIQEQLIPQSCPSDQIFALYQPMTMVGGDFYDFIEFKDSNKIGIFLSDVSGHGVPAAFVTSMIKSFVLQAKMKDNPAGLLSYLNNALINHTGKNFITAFYGIYDFKTRIFRYSSAGHNAPYIIEDDKLQQITSKKKSPPLVVLSNDELKTVGKEFTNSRKKIKPNSKLILYTDGLVEAVNIENPADDFEDSLLNEVLINAKDKDPEEFVNTVFQALIDFRGSNSFEDDVCLICLDTDRMIRDTA